MSASYLNIRLDIDSKERTIMTKRGYFNFPIVNFPFICILTPAAPAYGVYIVNI